MSAGARLSPLRIAAITAALLAVLIAVAIHLFEWNMLRDYVSRKVSEKTGRPFAINGDLTVELSLRPRIIARDVVLGNAPWAKEPHMAEIAMIDLTLDARSLLQRRIVLPHVTVSEARVLLEKNDQGVPNWDLAEPGPSEWRSQVEGLTIERGRLEYRDPGAKTKMVVEVSTTENAPQSGMLSVSARGQLKGMVARVDGDVGSVLELRTPENPYPISLRGTVGATKARIDGVLLDPLRLGGEDVKFELSGADLAQLLPIIGVPLPPTPAYKLSGHLNHKGAVWTFSKFTGTVGRSDLSGDFTVDRGKKPQLITASLASKSLDVKDLGGFVGAKRGERPSPQPPGPGRVLPREPFDLDHFRIADFDVKFRGRRITTGKLPLEDMSAHLKVKDGVVTLEPLDFGIAGGHLVSNIVMDARGGVMKTRAHITARKLHLQQLLPEFKLKQANAGIVSGRARLDTTGNSVAGMLAGANGDMGFMMEGGSVSELLTRLSHLDLAHALPMWLGSDRQLPVRCAVTHLEGRKGHFQAKTLVLDTEKTKITGGGYIDFASERLELKLVARPKDFSLVAFRGPIVVSGPFSNPTVRPEIRNAVGRGVLAVALGIVTGGPGAILPLLEFGGEKDSDCSELIAQIAPVRSASNGSK